MKTMSPMIKEPKTPNNNEDNEPYDPETQDSGD